MIGKIGCLKLAHQMSNSISIYCTQCKEDHLVSRTEEIPEEVVSLKCNWCPGCDAFEDYNEEYVYEEKEIINPNQIKLEI